MCHVLYITRIQSIYCVMYIKYIMENNFQFIDDVTHK